MSRRCRAPGLTGALLSLLLTFACSPAGKNAVPEDLVVVFGEGGGITGRWTGHTITADGALSRWTGHGLGDRTAGDPIKTLSAEELSAVWAKVEELGVLDEAREESGNMTRALVITANGAEHRTTWPAELPPGNASPAQVLYGYVRSLTLPTDDQPAR